MRVFISSVIRGFESFRRAAAEAVESLGYTVVRAEDFAARADTPQRACLEAARNANLTIVVLGARYGDPQESGLSATHEEFREAREHGAVLVFVQEGVEPEPAQAELIDEARAWATGRLTDTFRDPADLRSKVTRTLHEHVLRAEAGEADPAELAARARSLLPRHANRSASRMHIVVAGGPHREVLSPSQLEDPEFARGIIQQALFGSEPIFDPSEGTSSRVVDGGILVEQERATVEITEDGAARVAVPSVRRERDPRAGLQVLIEEDVRDALTATLLFAGYLLNEVDPHHRLSEVVVLAAMEGASYLGWKTREEHAANPGRVSIPMHASDLVVVPDQPRVRPRAAIDAGRAAIVDDLLVRLRRQLRS